MMWNKAFLSSSSNCCIKLIRSASCTTEKIESEIDGMNFTGSSVKTYVLNTSPSGPECPPPDYNTPLTEDIQIQFSEPLDKSLLLQLKVEISTNGTGYTEQPGILVMANEGDLNAVFPTSCHLPMRIECSEYTEVKSKTFRVSLVTETEYEPESQYYYLTAYRYCLNWEDGGGGSQPGGL